jgi:hypothetical protein
MVKQLLKDEAAERLNKIRISRSLEFLQKFKIAFQDECGNKDEYIALAECQRSYYLVYNRYRAEALFAINFNKIQKPVLLYGISSFARIVEKDNNTAPGWWYLNEVITQLFLPRYRKEKVKSITARLRSDGSKKAFRELLEFKGRNPGRYIVNIQGDSGTIEIREQ